MIYKRIKRRLDSLLYGKHFPFDAIKIKSIISTNRSTLKKMDKWIDEKVYTQSHFGYGLPKEYFNGSNCLINEEIVTDLTYTDALCYFSTLINNVKFLEIGVSVGKNFFQLASFFDKATIVGYDLEELNPLVKMQLNTEKIKIKKWDTDAKFIKPSASSFTENYTFKTNIINYVSADIYDMNGWECIKNSNFNMILSDACHSPEAILHEYEMLEKYSIINPNQFLIMWDDLGGEMTDSFVEIIKRMKKKYNISKSNCLLLELNGWVGKNEHKHLIGIIYKI